MMTAVYAQLYGGPLDGLELALPDYSDELRFPIFDASPALPEDTTSRFQEIVYERGDAEHRYRYTWRRP